MRFSDILTPPVFLPRGNVRTVVRLDPLEKYRNDKREVVLQRKRSEYRKNREKYLARRKAYYLANKEKELERIGEWKKKNAGKERERMRLYSRKRRAMFPEKNAEACRRYKQRLKENA